MTFPTSDDLHLFNEGRHFRLYDRMGAHPTTRGTEFAVWAPNATLVSVIGDRNGWKPAVHALDPLGASGLWVAEHDGWTVGDRYKYRIESRNGYIVDKADPFAFATEEPPRTGSVIADLAYTWNDDAWMRERGGHQQLASPIAVYEVHLGSWMRRDDGTFMPYREVAPRLAAYARERGFTHVELLPIMEHPFYGSWGYQTTGYYAPTARFGAPTDFMAFVDELHRQGVGVILDWVPSHFPSDEHGLAYFDGTHLFEHADPRQGKHPDWDTLVFNYSRNEVRSFLVSNAIFWLERYHADGLRVDAVASMLYLDYSRNRGEWIPNEFGGRENLEAMDFLRQCNEEIYRSFPDVHTYAEESTAWPGVSRPTYLGGLGFGFKWDMGWMHDTLQYFAREPVHRRFHHDELTFRGVYAWTENFVLPLSHDEVVHGKGSLVAKMPGDRWQMLANLRLLLGYQWAVPGKKLLFMGGEIAQWHEWAHDGATDWSLLEDPDHLGVQRWVDDLNRALRAEPALHERDADPDGFGWAVAGDADNSVLAFFRFGRTGRPVLFVANLTPVVRRNYRVPVPQGGYWQEVLNSDAQSYGGSGVGNLGGVDAVPVPVREHSFSLTLTVPPLGASAVGAGGTHQRFVVRIGAWPDAGAVEFRVWAPKHQTVDVVVDLVDDAAPERHRLTPVGDGFHEVRVDGLGPGTRYRLSLDEGEPRADPASRWQPDGVHGPSAVIDAEFAWSDAEWVGPTITDYVLMEIHVGTFTPEGTFDAVIDRLDALAALGITAVELMPIAEFPGGRNWGYDGVFPFAAQSTYGGPDGLRRLVDAAHARQMAVVLDVVYNHVGPEGNVLPAYGPYFTDRYRTPWGDALNFDGRDSDAVREFFVDSACQWICDFQIDALRLDAVHAIVDASAVPFVEQLTDAVHARADEEGRHIYVIAESAANDSRLITPKERGGIGCDAQWDDDFHHALHVLLTGERADYYADFGTLADLATAFRQGYTYAGRYSQVRGRRHGRSAADLPGQRFVVFAQNHDHIGNRAAGDRLSTLVDADGLRVAAATVLCAPFVPLLFMGEEYGETNPFPYFVSHTDPDLVERVRRGRREEFGGLVGAADVPDPQAEETFRAAILDWQRRETPPHADILEWHRHLLTLRRERSALRSLDPATTRTEAIEAASMLVVTREVVDDVVVLILAFGGEPNEVELALAAGSWQVLADSHPETRGFGAVVDSDGTVTLKLPPRSVLLLGTEPE